MFVAIMSLHFFELCELEPFRIRLKSFSFNLEIKKPKKKTLFFFSFSLPGRNPPHRPVFPPLSPRPALPSPLPRAALLPPDPLPLSLRARPAVGLPRSRSGCLPLQACSPARPSLPGNPPSSRSRPGHRPHQRRRLRLGLFATLSYAPRPPLRPQTGLRTPHDPLPPIKPEHPIPFPQS
jgi:hypothetical protein